MEYIRKKCSWRFCRLKLFYLWVYCKLVPADKALLRYKGKHEGEKCFLIGTAPSLTLDDLEMVYKSGLPTFSCNSIIKLFDRTAWRPTYFVLFDPYFYSCFRKEIDDMEGPTVFYNQIQIPGIRREGVAVKGSPEHLVREYMKHQKKKPQLVLSTNLMDRLVIGQSSMHSAIALAVWMGFKQIYLLGIDCDYVSAQHSNVTADSRLQSGLRDGLEMIQDFKDYKPQLEALGVEVINCSRGEKLKVFPCQKLEDVLTEAAQK